MLTDAVLTPAEEQKIHTPEQEWSDAFALKIVTADFDAAQQYRRYHDQRWELADRLYFGWEKQKTWEGTKIPRSSLGMFVVFQQIESLLPKVLSTIFSDTPWFEVGPQPGTSGLQAMAARDLMLYQMELARRRKNQSMREVMRRCIKSGFMYGCGIFEMGWSDYTQKRINRHRQMVPELAMHPQYGVPVATGNVYPQIVEQNIEKRHQTPRFNYVSIKDFFIDPNCPSPQVQEARFACTRAYVTVDELKAKRGADGFTIPADELLNVMAKHKPSRQSDVTKAASEAARGNNWQPQMDSSTDPGSKRIEVVTYWTADRCVWVANPGDETARVLYNEKNDYGFIPLFNAFYTDALDRFYGLSVVDVTEGEHRLQGAIINARVDELALSIHSARVKKRGSSIPAYQLRRRPGQIIEAETRKRMSSPSKR
jgi:hypothetical protein